MSGLYDPFLTKEQRRLRAIAANNCPECGATFGHGASCSRDPTWTEEKPTMALRFVQREINLGGIAKYRLILQQLWTITTRDGDKTFSRTEWRDVPQEEET